MLLGVTWGFEVLFFGACDTPLWLRHGKHGDPRNLEEVDLSYGGKLAKKKYTKKVTSGEKELIQPHWK